MSEAIDVIGDVHGCLDALRRLCGALGYDDDFHHLEGRTLAFVGDLIDRGPDSVGVLRVAVALHAEGRAVFALGNHDDALRRYLAGETVDIHDGGLDATIDQINAQPDAEQFKRDVLQLFTDAPLVAHLDGGKLILAHAGIEEQMLGREQEPDVRRFILNGDAIGKSPEGKTLRRDWAADYNGPAFIVYGHTPQPKAETRGRTANIDTGAYRGGRLSALRWPELAVVSIPSGFVYRKPGA